MKDSKHFIVTAASLHSTEDTMEDSKSWTPQKKEVLIMLVLMVISLMAALDATVLITILPVRGVNSSLIRWNFILTLI